ncbi:MAG: glycosyltransferase [Bacteroidetes bacterium]|nr:glycosyltransferase [Bacteroidota bacterium]
MRIAIVSYFFHPVLNPRSFRAFELGKELARRGHHVVFFVPDTGVDYTALEKTNNFKVNTVEPGFYLNKKNRNPVQQQQPVQTQPETVAARPGLVKKLKAKIIRWFYPGGFNFEFAYTCSKVLKKQSQPFDLVISVGLPICAHLAVSKARRRNKQFSRCCIADYGDPYSFSKIINPPYFHRWLERRMLKQFDFILTPTSKGVHAFRYFKPDEKIKVIPQGFDFTQIKRADTVVIDKSKPVHFVFSGNFYKEARNPKELFEFLTSTNRDYCFTLFINTGDSENREIIAPYLDKMGARLVVKPFVERLECIYEMSKADFLVNISNTHDEHTPSKLIDYKLTGRPIFSYVPGKFDPQVMAAFMDKNYVHDLAPEINLEPFDIRNVVDGIMKLTTGSKVTE